MKPLPDDPGNLSSEDFRYAAGQHSAIAMIANPEGSPLGLEAARAARFCGVSRATWYSLRKAGRLPKPVRLGRRVLWRVEELREWMAAGCPPLSRWEVMKKGRWA
jgi:predicted DNA-binding transcriptional regulator AlpA